MSSHANLGVVIGHDGNRLYGFDAELFLKMENKRDRAWERTVLEWVQACIEEPLADLDDIWASCKSGVVLCKLINVLKPNTIKKYSVAKLSALVERDNIDLFLQACWKFGIPASDMFNSGDLHSRKAITQVYQCLFVLSQVAPSLGWKGPTIKPQVAAEKKAAPAKKFEKVQAGPKTVHVDALVAGDSTQSALLELQLKNAELDSEFKALKAEKYNKDQEILQLRKDLKVLQDKIKAGPVAAAPESSDGLPDEEQALQIVVLEREAELFKLKNADLQRKIADLTKQRDAATNAEVAELKRRLGTLSKDNADLRMKVESYQKMEQEKSEQKLELKEAPLLRPADSPRASHSSEKRMSFDIPATRSPSVSVSTNWKSQSSAEVRDGFHSNVSSNMMSSVEGLLTNILAGTAVDFSNVMKVGNLLPSESGRRAFSYVLDNVLEKVAFIQQQTAAVASLGFDLVKYGRRGKPHPRTVKVFAKTGVVDWGTDKMDIRDVVAIEKGKTTKVFHEHAAVEDNKCMSLISEDRTLDVEAPSRLERDNFYWACMTVWDIFNLEKLGIYVSPLVIPDDHFQHVVFLCNQAIEEFQLDVPGAQNIDVMALALIMSASERICTRSKQRVDGKYKFVQEMVRHHFRDLPASFWEEAFWRQQTKLLRERAEEQGDRSDESAEESEIWLTEQICNWSRSLWAWGLDAFHVKEVMKLMHGSNKLQDATLFELLRYVDCMEVWKKLGPKNLEREGIKHTQQLIRHMSKPLKKASKKNSLHTPEKTIAVEGYGGGHLAKLDEDPNENQQEKESTEGSRKSSIDKGADEPLTVQVDDKPQEAPVGRKLSEVASPKPAREKAETVSSPKAVDPKAEAKRLKKEREQAEIDAKLYSKRKQEEAKEKLKREEEKAKQDKLEAAKKAREEAAAKKNEPKSSKKSGMKPSEKPKNVQLLTDLRDGILVDGCTRDTKEQALPDDLFEEIFAMPKKDFNVLPTWQKTELKKKHNLF